jgi:hypothetical protein
MIKKKFDVSRNIKVGHIISLKQVQVCISATENYKSVRSVAKYNQHMISYHIKISSKTLYKTILMAH